MIFPRLKRRVYFLREYSWTDPVTGCVATVPQGYPSDGATGVIDIKSKAWGAHDVLCDRRAWDDGTPCTPRSASRVLKDILKKEGRIIRAPVWGFFTFLWTSIGWRFGEAPGMKMCAPELAGEIHMIPGGVRSFTQEKPPVVRGAA